MAAVVLLGGAAVWAGVGGEDHKSEARFTSSPDVCSSVPGATLERYVPNAEGPSAVPATVSAQERYAACAWEEPVAGKGGTTLTSHRLNVAVRLHLDDTGRAQAEYDDAWRGAGAMAGTAKAQAGSIDSEAPSVVGGVGDRMFTQHRTLDSALGRSGTVAATVLLRNAVITVEYRGATFPLERDGTAKLKDSRPMDEATARAGAEAVARDLVGALNACGKCLSR
ncbi:hypothetical protein [Actinomadura fibrosa]|uniref:DUF3558 domain-containing protein n=1 Tax=Actinomadura fibrosa TaxID=111802 RepID=A0ABW2XZ80_9ACTN|nr:hypothetical protein [Actinomadura fibrosa]